MSNLKEDCAIDQMHLNEAQLLQGLLACAFIKF